ncbi:MAG: bifunctional 3-(3-hydroxy-phenyl)propionate/3-hydroxycinnamic acid hydroxylase [Halioglobus sp.]
MTSKADFDVIVVGAGPVGAAASLLLADYGLEVLVIDKEAQIYPLPRAAHIDHEIVRVLQSVGAADDVMATSRPAESYNFLTADRQTLMRFNSGHGTSPSGWPASNMIHQPSLEEVIRQKIATRKNITLKTSWALTSIEQDQAQVTLELETPAGPMQKTSCYVIACDGAGSTVRSLLDIELEDLGFDEPWLVIDTIVHDQTKLPDANLQICDPARPTTCVLMGAGRHRWEFMLLPGETPEAVLEDEFIEQLLAPWDVASAVSLERKAVYRFHALMAKQWRKSRVFLAGDAAHQMPPFAGQGLCSGIRDVANLAWKLSQTTKPPSEALLDSYQLEREPQVKMIIDLAIMMGQTVCITDRAAADQRDKDMLAQRGTTEDPSGAMALPPLAAGCLLEGSKWAGTYFPQPWNATDKLDDVLEKSAWLISHKKGASSSDVQWVSLLDEIMEPFAPALAGWLEENGCEAVLVRPDRYVFGTGTVIELLSAYNSQVGILTPTDSAAG